eukprot:2170855-Lingulodinium_polyedra.AAC.1
MSGRGQSHKLSYPPCSPALPHTLRHKQRKRYPQRGNLRAPRVCCDKQRWSSDPIGAESNSAD